MIRADDRVSSVLARAPALLEVFLQTSPSFAMLKNPMARKTMAKLVTIEQAARVAGVEAQVLLARLNAALGEAGADPTSGASGAAPDATGTKGATPAPRPPAPFTDPAPSGLLETPDSRLLDLDVREDLRAGQEPLRRILDAVRGLPEGHVFRLRAIFEPAPLYDVLAKQGFGHFTERIDAEDWRVWFYRDPNARNVLAARVAEPVAAPDPDGDVVIVDVRDLEPPEPMMRTLEALSRLERGRTLVQINARVPQFLLPKLEERGFSYEIREQSQELVRIFIRHKNP